MNGPDFVADTNAIIYLMEGNKKMLPFVKDKFAISVVTEIELLGWHNIKKEEIAIIKNILEKCFITELSKEIRDISIQLKQIDKIPLPDAIVAATSIYWQIPILTADKGFKRIKGIDLLLLE